MRPLKIALLSRWYAEESRRAQRSAPDSSGSVQQLAEAVAALGHEVVVLSQSRDVQGLQKSQIGALEVWLSPREKRRPGWTAWRDKLAKHTVGHRKIHSDALDLCDFLARRGPFDVLWAQCEEPDGLVAAVAAPLTPLMPPTLVQMYALRYRFREGHPVFTEQPALCRAFRHATRILANSELVARQLHHYAGAKMKPDELLKKTSIIPHNLQRDFQDVVAAAGTAAEPEPGRVLFLGALNEKKGALDFLAALDFVATPHARFAMTGAFTEKGTFARRWEQALAKARAGAKPLEMLGKISPAEVITQIQRAQVVVIPSLFDECPRALVEVLALGRPVITTTGVGNSPLVSEHQAGVVVAPGQPIELAKAMDDVLRPDAPYAGHAKASAPKILQDHSAETLAVEIERHLREIVRS